MQGFERMDRQFLDAAAVAGHLIPENSMFVFLAAHGVEVSPTRVTRTCSARRGWAGRHCRPRRWLRC